MALSMKLEIASNRRSRSPSTGTLPLLANLTRGTAPSSALTRPPAAKTRRGAVLVDEFLRLPDHPEVLRDRGRVALDGSSSDHDRPIASSARKTQENPAWDPHWDSAVHRSRAPRVGAREPRAS